MQDVDGKLFIKKMVTLTIKCDYEQPTSLRNKFTTINENWVSMKEIGIQPVWSITLIVRLNMVTNKSTP